MGIGQDGLMPGSGGSAVLPVIDVGPLAGRSPAAARAGVAGQIQAACRERGATEMGLELLVPRQGTHPAKERLHEWYSRLGYRIAGRDDFAAAYPEVGDLLAVPCDLRRYRKRL